VHGGCEYYEEEKEEEEEKRGGAVMSTKSIQAERACVRG
jgi:hypothetical protein